MRRLMKLSMRELCNRLPQAARATVFYALGIVWSRGVGLLMVPVLTAHLLPESFGRLELLSSAAEIGGLMVGAGLVETLFRFASPNTKTGREAAADVMGLAITLGVVCLAVLALFGGSLARAMPLATSTSEIWLLGLMITMDAILGVPMGWLRITGAARKHALTSGCRAMIQAGIVALLLHKGFGVSGVLAGGAAASLLAAIWLGVGQARGTGISLHARGWPRLLSYGAPLLGTGIASFVLGSADRWLLAGSVPAASLGHYALAMRFAMIVAMLMQPFDMWWYARRMAVLETPEGLASSARAIRIGVCGIAVASAVTAASGPMLISHLAPASYAPAMAMVPWLVLALSVQMLSSLVNVGCYTGRSTLMPLTVNCVAAAIALSSYLLLIPSYGVPGAIAATLLAQVTRLVLFTILAQRRLRVDLPYAATLLLAASAAGCAALPQILEPGTPATVATLAAALTTTLIAGAVSWSALRSKAHAA